MGSNVDVLDRAVIGPVRFVSLQKRRLEFRQELPREEFPERGDQEQGRNESIGP